MRATRHGRDTNTAKQKASFPDINAAGLGAGAGVRNASAHNPTRFSARTGRYVRPRSRSGKGRERSNGCNARGERQITESARIQIA
jgi:hypothetical protein